MTWARPAVLLLSAALAFAAWRPPSPLPASASPDAFSAERASEHVRALAAAPHPVGSPRHAEARRYLVESLERLGLTPEVSAAPFVGAWRGTLAGATLHNVVARVPGLEGGRAVLVSAHYDSVPTSEGAGDDGAGAAAMIEVARALRAGPPLKNDVLLLFADGEELGLLGAQAFRHSHQQAGNVAVALNFDARGTSGPSMMFEPSSNDGWLIRHLARAPHPVANSLSMEVYKLLPGDTDFTVFRSAGVRGLNFAFIDGFVGYHTRLDTPARLDPRSLQHHGETMLSLVRELGRADLDAPPEAPRAYFDLPGAGLLSYPLAWATPLALIAVACSLVALRLAWRRGHVRRLALAPLAFAVVAAAAPALVALLWWALLAVERQVRALPFNHTYHQLLYFFGFGALVVALQAAVAAGLERRLGPMGFAAGAQLVWAALALLSAWFVPGASHVFVWPLFGSALSLAAQAAVAPGERPGRPAALAIALGAVPALVLLGPTLYAVHVALRVDQIEKTAVAMALAPAPLLPQLVGIASPALRRLSAAAALAGAALVVGTWSLASYDAEHPRLDSLAYVVDADTGRASWVSFDDELDEWTGALVGDGARDPAVLAVLPGSPRAPFAHAAPPLALPTPSLEIIDDTTSGESRELRLRLRSGPEAARLTFRLESPVSLLGADVAGQTVDATALARNRHALDYWAPPEALEVTFRLRPREPLRLRLIEHFFGLPPAVPPRPARLSPQPDYGYGLTDSSYVSKAFVL